MKIQNYDNHVRYYTPHHFVYYPIVAVCFGGCLWMAWHETTNALLWWVLALVFLFLAALSFMTRQHYALVLQNRTVRLELRFRYYVLTQQRLEALEAKFTRHQLYALRFASDEELPALVKRAAEENLTPDAIKRSIRNWLPDTMRV